MKAHEWLRVPADTLEQRGKEYDKPEGERSMTATITAFNAITGQKLDARHGWLLLHLLKKVRLWTNESKFHRDSAIDSSAYDALEHEEWDNKFAQELLQSVELENVTSNIERDISNDPRGEKPHEEDHVYDLGLR